ncbi:hypothetical protein KEM56_001795 [Ascosphaera pollenicola]|nr:hypothetical protein KEM56_001795 [Ascosphaera pollenicola]
MVLKNTLLQCSLCLGSVDQQKWTEQYYSAYKLQNCADPAASLVPESVAAEYKQRELPSQRGGFPLPPELVLIVLESLSSKELISFLNASSQTLSCAPLYLRHYPNRFFPNSTLTGDSDTLFATTRAIYKTYTAKDYQELDEKWKLLDRLQVLSAPLSEISEAIDQPSWSFTEPPNQLSHPFGFQRYIAKVPADVSELSIYRRELRAGCYICGLGWNSASQGERFFGNAIGIKKTVALKENGAVLNYVTDQLGVKDLSFGNDSGFRDPDILSEWTGQSIKRQRAQFEIITDSLKFRSIRWLLGSNDEPEFGELMLMKGTPLTEIWFGPEAYHTTYPDRDPDFIHGHGQFAVEVILFKEGLTGITIYDDECSFGKIGMETHYENGEAELVGWRSKFSNHFSLGLPGEQIEEVDVQTQYLSVLNRDISMVAPRGHRVSGLYFRVGKESTMESVGLISELTSEHNEQHCFF